jgi:hypothetical protein
MAMMLTIARIIAPPATGPGFLKLVRPQQPAKRSKF